jgi:hypothetical protein
MAEVYRVIADRKPEVIKPSELFSVPGTLILRDMSRPDVPSLFASFCRYFRAQRRWIWDGGKTTPRSADILDGVRSLGQCAALAQAFRALATLPKPYGLGLTESQVGDPNGAAGGLYKGRFNNGFVAAHGDLTSPGVVLGLQSNVFSVPTHAVRFSPVTIGSPRTNLYLWENHKTVPYLGRYYDPSYGRVWDAKEQMAMFHIRESVPIKRTELTADNKQKTTTYYTGVGTSNAEVYFRDLLDEEVRSVQCRGYQGPFATLPGQPWDGPSVAELRQEYQRKVDRLQSN